MIKYEFLEQDIGTVESLPSVYPSMQPFEEEAVINVVKALREREFAEPTDMDKLTTEMMEHICDNLCKHPCNAKDQEELDEICAECIMGKFVCSILNAHNRLKRPCKAGDKVYQTDSAGTVFESKITKIIYDTNGIAFDESAIGKTVFLTEQAALEKMKGE